MSSKLQAQSSKFRLNYLFFVSRIVKDDVDEIKKAVLKVKDESDLIILSGGTGFTPDDVTPEAIESLIVQQGGKRAASLVHYMQSEALKITPMTCLSRTCIAIFANDRNSQTIVVTLPGKPKAVKEDLDILTGQRVLQFAMTQCKNKERHQC